MPRTQQLHSADYPYDETLGMDGTMLPGWQSLLAYIEGLSPDQRALRESDIIRQMRANGLAYDPENNLADNGRPWVLDLVPMLVDQSSWETLTAGLNQRARLKQALYQDIYGGQRVLSEGIVPAAMLYSHQHYLRDLVCLDKSEPATDILPMFSCDIKRLTSGDWMVVNDLCQYPSGIGYALENRIVLSRVLQRTFSEHRVQRIVSYFRRLQSYIHDPSSISARCVLLSYPPTHPHYFEFAWLAKYLGYPLVEPADLTVRDNHVFIKTITGLQAVDVVLRLIEDSEMDPLITGNTSNLGVPGIVEAARRGGVRVLNPMGAGVLDNPAFNSILEPLCKTLLDETLLLQSPVTYWLGDTQQRSLAMAQTDAFTFCAIDTPTEQLDTALMTEAQKTLLWNRIEQAPADFVAQERISGSVVPGLHDTGLKKSHVTVRTYLVNNGSGYEAMPGGLCFIDKAHADSSSSSEHSKNSSNSSPTTSPDTSKDLWVLSDEPVFEDTLLSTRIDASAYEPNDGELPSRIAESIFWLGRNAERVESTLRLLRSILRQLLDKDRPLQDSLAAPAMQCLLRSLTAATDTLPGFTGRGGKKRIAQPGAELISLMQDTNRIGSLSNSLQLWQQSASAVSDRLSTDQLRVFNRLSEVQATLGSLQLLPDFCADESSLFRAIEVLDELLLITSACTGLEHENVTHSDTWLFMMLGRRIERAHKITVIVNSVMSVDKSNPHVLEVLLRLFDSVMTYRSRYRNGLDNRLVLQLLLLDEINPRSLAFQFKRIEELIMALPGRRVSNRSDPISRLAVAGLSRVRLADTQALLDEERDARQNLNKFLQALQKLPVSMADAVTTHYFTHAESRQELGNFRAPPAGVLTAVDSTDNSEDL